MKVWENKTKSWSYKKIISIEMCLRKTTTSQKIFKVPRLLQTRLWTGALPQLRLTYLHCLLSASWHWSKSPQRQGLLFPWSQRQRALPRGDVSVCFWQLCPTGRDRGSWERSRDRGISMALCHQTLVTAWSHSENSECLARRATTAHMRSEKQRRKIRGFWTF